MLSEVNKVNKDNSIFVSFLLYFVPIPPLILTPPFNNFSKSLKPPVILTPPPFIRLVYANVIIHLSVGEKPSIFTSTSGNNCSLLTSTLGNKC